MLLAKDSTTLKKKKTTQGRKKIEIKKIENLSSRQVTFSKRRRGLFKKASELCILSAAEVAIIIHSPGKRVFTFGHPTTDAVIERFLKDASEPGSGSEARENCAATMKIREFNKHYLDMCKDLEAEKKRKDLIEAEKRAAEEYGCNVGAGFWWDEPVDSMPAEELEQYMAALGELMNNVTMRANDLMHARSSSNISGITSQSLPVNVFGAVSSLDKEGCSMFGNSAVTMRANDLMHAQISSNISGLATPQSPPVNTFGAVSSLDMEGCYTFGDSAVTWDQNPANSGFDFGGVDNSCMLPNVGDFGQVMD